MAAPPPWEGWDEPPSCPPLGGKQSAWRPLPLGKVGMSPPRVPPGGENNPHGGPSPLGEVGMSPPRVPPGGENNPHGGPSPLGEVGRGLLPFFVRMCQIIRSQWGGGHLDEALSILG